MSRSPVFPVEAKVRIVLSVLAGETTIAEAGRKAKVAGQSVGNWKHYFLEADKLDLAAGESSRPSGREERLAA